MATGCLSRRAGAGLPGPRDASRASWYHTGHWPHEGVDFTGQRVGVIGTGSSAHPVDPDHRRSRPRTSTVFQRTPNFSVPGAQRARSTRSRAAGEGELRRVPARRRASRASASSIERSERVRARRCPTRSASASTRSAGSSGGLGFAAAFADLLDRRGGQRHRRRVRPRQDPRRSCSDPEVAELLCPTDYPLGTKRLCVDTDYYETFNRDNVTLVDLRETPIEEITPTGSRTQRRRVRRSTPSSSPPASTR